MCERGEYSIGIIPARSFRGSFLFFGGAGKCKERGGWWIGFFYRVLEQGGKGWE